MLSRELEVTLNLAFKDARAKRHELMSVEHLLHFWIALDVMSSLVIK